MKGCVVFVVVKGMPGHEEDIAMVQEKNKPTPKLWKLAGGTKENGEFLEATAYREIHEELGIVLKALSEDDIIYRAELNGKYGSYDFVLFEGRYYSGAIQIGSEIERIEFFTKNQIAEMIKNKQIVKNHALALKSYLNL